MAHRASHRAVVVEDDEPTAELLCKLLEHLNCTVVSTPDNASALDQIKLELPDLITTDIFHPGPNGIELVRALREDLHTSDIPIIVISGSCPDDTELMLYRLGVTAVIHKPFQMKEFISRLSQILDIHSDQDTVLLKFGFETFDLDYKQYIDLSIKEARAALAKDVIAMANSGGGTIILGVDEIEPGCFQHRGLSPEQLKEFEVTKVNDALRKYVGSAVTVQVKRLTLRNKTFVMLKVPPCEDTIVLASSDNATAGLFQGRIYMRTHEARTAEVRDSITVTRLIERLINARMRKRLNDGLQE